MILKTVRDIQSFKNKRVLLRCDFNVPIISKRDKIKILDHHKIDACLPTILTLKKHGAITIIASHLGRPNSKNKKGLSLLPVAKYLSYRLPGEVILAKDYLDSDFVAAAKNDFKPGQVILLENLRFYPSEEKNSSVLAKKLSRLADYYVNDAFACSHRAHASVSAITKFLPSFAGINLEREVENLNDALTKHRHPAVAVIGGVKIATKIAVIENLAKKFDHVLIGGALANNFIKDIGFEVGKSIIDRAYLKEALRLLNDDVLSKKIIIPFDVRVAGGREFPRKSTWRHLAEVEENEYILDIGPRTEKFYSKLIHQAKTVVWNGPMGYCENLHFRQGSFTIAKAIARNRGHSVVGGGETLEIINRLHLSKKISFVSTGGGAMLEFLSGKILPGLKPLLKK